MINLGIAKSHIISDNVLYSTCILFYVTSAKEFSNSFIFIASPITINSMILFCSLTIYPFKSSVIVTNSIFSG